MKIKELIEKLKKYPQDMRVIVEGYENGYNDISIIKKLAIITNANTEDYYGAHAESDDENLGEKALLLAGENTNAEDF